LGHVKGGIVAAEWVCLEGQWRAR